MAADVAAALGTPCSSSGCSSTMTVGNAGELHIDCGKAGDGGSATSELCRMLDRLDVTAAATLFLHRLLFERLTAGSGGNGGAVYLRSGSGAAVTVAECTFRTNIAGAVRQPTTPTTTRHLAPLKRFWGRVPIARRGHLLLHRHRVDRHRLYVRLEHSRRWGACLTLLPQFP